MKKALLLVCLLCGCVGELKVVEEKDGSKTLNGDDPIREFEYDGCEYIAFGVGNHKSITHKGNCKNHR